MVKEFPVGAEQLRMAQGWQSIALLVSYDEDEDHDWNADAISIREVRCYDLLDHATVARQFTRELVLQGCNPDPDTERIVVMGGRAKIEHLPGTELPVTRVPFTVWKPIPPPPKPEWQVQQQ